MKKMKTLFVRDFTKECKATREVEKGYEWVFTDNCVATVKIDGTCCAIIDGILYKRYDAKFGKIPPKDFIQVDKYDNHNIGWIKVDFYSPDNKYIVNAYNTYMLDKDSTPDGTYEAIGEHILNNPYNINGNILRRHGDEILDVKFKGYDNIKEYLFNNYIEGIVFYNTTIDRFETDRNDCLKCKIKRTDFGFVWNGFTHKVK